MEEIWKSVKGFDDYEVSNLGMVKSLKFGREKILKYGTERLGYRYVILFKNNNRLNITIHKLVAIAFLNHKPCGHELVVDHIDNNPSNNRLDNLQIITHRENVYKTQGNYSSKYKGVSWSNRKNKWISQIQICGKSKYLGSFNCEIKASEIYKTALLQL